MPRNQRVMLAGLYQRWEVDGVRRCRSMGISCGEEITEEELPLYVDDEKEAIRLIRANKNHARPGAWWCCKADFGQHEPTCRNYRAFTPATVRNWIREELAKHDIPNEHDPYPDIIMAVVHRLDEQEAKG